MKVCFFNTWSGGAIYNVFRPVYDAMAKDGDDVVWRQLRGGEEGVDLTADVVHFSYFRNMPALSERLASGFTMPVTCSVHHLHPQHVWPAVQHIQAGKPTAVHTADPFCLRQLQQHGVANVHLIPYTIDWERWPMRPLPPTFTVGYLGCDYNTKRFNVIEEGAKLAGVPCVGLGRKTLNEEEQFVTHEEVMELYAKMSCYVVASYNDGGPLPPMEAMLMGRPVATTHVGMMPQVIIEGFNGTFHNGTPDDIARAIERVAKRVGPMHEFIEKERAFEALLPTTESVVPKWRRFFEEALCVR